MENNKNNDKGTGDKKDEVSKFESVMRALEKKHGKGTVVSLTDVTFDGITDTISTGSLGVDHVIGIGGIPRGKITEIFGKEGSGKSTLTLKTIANANKMGLRALLIDIENSFDRSYASRLGIDSKLLKISQPTTAEEALDIMVDYTATGLFGVVVLDSVAGLYPKAELEGDIGDSHMGITARLMGQACRALRSSIGKTNTAVIMINQTRDTMGYGKTTTGGNALRFFSHLRLETRIFKKIVSPSSDIIGIQTEVKSTKNKVGGPPFRKALMTIIFGKGISIEDEIIDYAASYGLIKQAGSWYSYGDEKIGQGRRSVKKWLADNENKKEEIVLGIKEILKSEDFI